LNKFREIVSSLAKPNKCTLQHLLKHLLRVADLSDFNRMQIPNLAIVFGPTLMWPAVESQNMALDLMQQNLVIEKLLIEYEAIFQ
jgi:Flp pilus assembly protein protease CpaA